MKAVFLQPRFVGARFEEATLPVEVARDLAAYQDLVIELAKHLYLEEHQFRQRTPKGFSDAFSLHIEKVEEGSTRPLLIWVAAAALGALPFKAEEAGSNYFTQARDLVAECVSASAANQPLPAKFPKPLLDYFNVLGRSLLPGESVDLAPPDFPAAVLTPERRKALVLAGQRFYTQAVDLLGVIEEMDGKKESFRLRLDDGGAVVVHLPGFFEERVRMAWNKKRTQVQVKGIGSYDARGNLQGVPETLNLEVFPNQTLAGQIEELGSLQDGWLGESSKAPDEIGLAWARDQLVATFPDDLPFPQVAPTAEGGLFLEWVNGPMCISAEFLLPAHQAELLAVNVETEAADDQSIDLDANPDASWPALYDFVRQRL